MATNDERKVLLDEAAPIVCLMDITPLARLIRDMAAVHSEPQRSAAMIDLAERYADQIWKEITNGTHRQGRQQQTTQPRRVTS